MTSALTSAFFAAEKIVADIDPVVSAAGELGSRTQLRSHWATLRERHGEVTATYLQLTQPNAHGMPSAREFQDCEAAFTTVTESMGAFQQQHDAELTRARGAMQEAITLDQQARVSATAATQRFEQTGPSIAHLRPVRMAVDELADAAAAFERAVSLPDRRDSARRVITAASLVESTLTEAPGYAERAQQVIRSVETRRAAILTRRGRLPDAISALRREFSADCSADLEKNDAAVESGISEFDALLTAARSHLGTAPDLAITEADGARMRLDIAEQAVDQVLDRLTILREVRADPQSVARRVRFRLRDAQQFTVAHSLVDEWGSVLDAQAERIDRAESALERVHPDYWGYLSELNSVDERITTFVARMRGQVVAS